MDDDDDDEDEEDMFKPTPKPKAAAPPRESEASENIRATEPPAPTPPPVKKEDPPSPKKGVDTSPPRKSIKELAALIKPGTLGGGRPMGARPPVSRAQTQEVGGITANGEMDHGNFVSKPTTTGKKKAAKKNVFFSDSDEMSGSEEEEKPKPAPAKPVVPMKKASPPKPKEPEPVVVKEPEPQVAQAMVGDASTRHMWGDGQWHPDENGYYFYYDEVGQMIYYQGEAAANDYGNEANAAAQDADQDMMDQMDRFAMGTRDGGASQMPKSRPSMQAPTDSPAMARASGRISVKRIGVST